MSRSLFVSMVLLLLAGVVGCGNSKESASETPAYIREAGERFGEDFVCEPNTPGDYVLCAHRGETTAMSPVPKVAYFVYDEEAAEIVLEEALFDGRVKWVGDYELQKTRVPGIVTDDGSGAPTYSIDVRTRDERLLDGADGIPK